MKSKSAAAAPMPQKAEAAPRCLRGKYSFLPAWKTAPGSAHSLFGGVAPPLLLACTACAGKSTDALASGMNWGIFTLLGVVLSVLSCLVVFFVHVARRSPPDDNEATPPEQCK
jgi:hypothetical protein